MTSRRILPDPDGELSAVLDVLEDVLLLVPEMDSSSGPTVAGRPLPVSLDEPAEAVYRLCRAIAPSQKLSGRSGRGRLLAPDGRYEHLPMSLIEIEPGDVEVVADAVHLLGSCPAPQAVTDAVDALASDLTCLLPGRLASGADLRAAAICHLERAVQILQVTGSGDTAPDTAVLRQPLSTAAGGVDIAFTSHRRPPTSASPVGSTRSGRTAPPWTAFCTSPPGAGEGQERRHGACRGSVGEGRLGPARQDVPVRGGQALAGPLRRR